MIPLRDNVYTKQIPLVTYTIAVLIVGIYIWDRGGSLFSQTSQFADFAMRPRQVLQVFQGREDPTAMSTIFTSLFLHGNLAHLLGNLLFLIVFGENVEAAMGPVRFALYYLAWGILAAMTHVWVNPGSMAPTLGASGAIGGVLGAYFLLYPGNRIRFVLFPIVFVTYTLAAWAMLGIWFLAQIVLPQPGVANWAHAGGFLSGMLTVLVMGGREKVLRNLELITEKGSEDWD